MEVLKVAIIGCGRVAAKHLKAIKTLKKNLVLVGVSDTNSDNANKLLSEFGFKNIPVYSDFKQMLDEKKPDICALTVPSGLHYMMACECLNRKINILLEKPMTMSSAEAKDLYELSRKTEAKICMGHIYRYFPLVGLIQKDIENGVYGKVTHGVINVRWGHNQDYYDSAAWRGTWKSDGGALMNQTIHAVDLLFWLMGLKPVSVTASISKRLRNIEAEDLGMAVFTMENGALSMIEGTTATLENNKEAMFSISCEKGFINLGLRKGMPFLNILNEKGKKINGQYIRRQLKVGGFKSFKYALNPHTGIYADLVESIRNGKDPIADAYAGYTSVDNLLGIYKSAKLKTPVELPLTEPFCTLDMADFFEKKNI